MRCSKLRHYNPLMRILPILIALGIGSAGQALAAGRPMTTADLLAMQRVSEPQLSPDGSRVLYTVAVPDLAGNRTARNVWIVPTAGGEARALTSTGKDAGAKWAPDGRRIAFISTRGGSAQIYLVDADGTGEPTRLTNLSGGADNIVWSPDGRTIAFTSEVYPDCRDEACNAKRDEEREKNPVRARVYDRLLYRHWTSWSEGKRNHLFVVPAAGGDPRDVTAGADYDVPPREREGPHPIAFAPGQQDPLLYRGDRSRGGDEHQRRSVRGRRDRRIAETADDEPRLRRRAGVLARRQDHRVPLAGASGLRVRQVAADALDRASGRQTSLTDGFDRSVDTAIWSSDGKSIYFNAEDRGEMPLFVVPATGGAPRRDHAGRVRRRVRCARRIDRRRPQQPRGAGGAVCRGPARRVHGR